MASRAGRKGDTASAKLSSSVGLSARALEMLNESCLSMYRLPPSFPNAASAVTTNYFVCCIRDAALADT